MVDDKVQNYIIIICIVLLLAYFFKGFAHKKYEQGKNLLGGFIPGFNFIYL
jgi:hypothetical protein